MTSTSQLIANVEHGPLLTLEDYQSRARTILAGSAWDGLFSARGDRTWRTNQANIAAFDTWTLRPRVLRGVDTRDLATTVLGTSLRMPIMVAPSGSHQRVHPQGECATARAAGRAGTAMVLSSVSNFSIEEVAAVATGPLWFQLYVLKDRELTLRIVRRAEAAGYRALVVTVDNLNGRLSMAQRHNAFPMSDGHLEAGRELSNFPEWPEGIRPRTLTNHIERNLSWRDIEWLVEIASIPVVVKGIQAEEDARLAVESGAKAIVVSNHGGVPPEMEGLRASLHSLPEVVDAVGKEVEVYFDGGIRTGRDVLKALGLGARVVFTGRPIQWGLAVDGEEGALGVLETLRRELDSMMGLCGVVDVNHIDPRVVCPANPFQEVRSIS